MQWTDEALILDVGNYGEHAAIIHLFSKQHGRYNAVSKAARSSKQRAIYQPANLVEATWKARLQEHMGHVNCELVGALGLSVMQDTLRLSAMMSVCALLKLTVPERDPHPDLFETAKYLLLEIAHASPESWQVSYARFEWLLLSQCGIGLDISSCVATGARENLVYVSPKSARAVCQEAGAPYHDKLLPLPEFLHQPCELTSLHPVLEALTLTGYFLEHWWAAPHDLTLPVMRSRLVALMRKQIDSPP